MLTHAFSAAESQTGQPEFSAKLRLQEESGKWTEPLALSGVKAVVFIFVTGDCPISNRYAPKFKRMAMTYEPRGVGWRLVYPNSDDTMVKIRQHLKEYDLPLKAFRDPQHELTRLAGVKVTPEAAVYVRDKGWVYHGRIDNRFEDFGKARPEATREDLQEVLDAVLAQKPIRTSSTRAVGCTIPDNS